MTRVRKDDVLDMLSRRHPLKSQIDSIVRPEDISDIADIVIAEVGARLSTGDRAGADAVLRRAVHAQVSALDLYEAAIRSVGGS